MRSITALLIARLSACAQALHVQYCSTLNTASTPQHSSEFQSNSLCRSICLSSYAFAIVQGDGCWCSNDIPMNTTAISECDEPCPGLSTDTCGSQGLFGYVSLVRAPAGAEGLSAIPPITSSITFLNAPSITSSAVIITQTTDIVSTAYTASGLSIYPAASNPSRVSSSSPSSLPRISTPAKFGIAISCCLLLIAAIFGAMRLFRRRKGFKRIDKRVPAYPYNHSSLGHQDSTQRSQQDRRAWSFAPSTYELAAAGTLSSQDTEIDSSNQPPLYHREMTTYSVELKSKEALVPPPIGAHPAYQTLSLVSPVSPLSPLHIRDTIPPPEYYRHARSKLPPSDAFHRSDVDIGAGDGLPLVVSTVELPLKWPPKGSRTASSSIAQILHSEKDFM